MERTLKTVEKADIALLLYEADGTLEQQWLKLLAAREIPVILILNKADSRQDTASVVLRIEKECGQAPVVVSAKEVPAFKVSSMLSSKSFPRILVSRLSRAIW